MRNAYVKVVFCVGLGPRLAEETEFRLETLYRRDGFVYPMDTYREDQFLHELWASNRTPWKVWEQ